MDWQAVTAVVTALGVVGGFFLTWRGLRQERELHQAAASRSEAAARLTEDYSNRLVDALESIAETGLGAAAPPARPVRWSLVHHSGDVYRLTNEGDRLARGVALSADPTLHLSRAEGGPDLGPGEAMTFMAAASMATKDRTVTVTWEDDRSEDRQTWRYPLPGRPPRG